MNQSVTQKKRKDHLGSKGRGTNGLESMNISWLLSRDREISLSKNSEEVLSISPSLRTNFSPWAVPSRSSSSTHLNWHRGPGEKTAGMDGPLSKLQNRESTHEFVKSNQIIVMEHQVAVEHKNIVRAKLKECILQNFENANENCYDLRLQYANMVKDRFAGMLFPAGLEPTNRVNRNLVEKK